MGQNAPCQRWQRHPACSNAPAPKFTIRNNPFPWWMLYLPSNVQRVAEGAGQIPFIPTKPVMQTKIRKPRWQMRIIPEIEINSQNTAEAWENVVPSSKASLPEYSIIIGKDRFEKRDDSHKACFS